MHLGPAARFGIPELGAGQRFAGYLVEQREQAVVILCRYHHRRRPQQRAMGAEQAQRAAIGGQADALQQGHAPVVGGRQFVEHVQAQRHFRQHQGQPAHRRQVVRGRLQRPGADALQQRGEDVQGGEADLHPAGRVQVADAAPVVQLAAQFDETRHRRQLRIEGVEQAAPAQALGAAQQVLPFARQQRMLDQHVDATRHQRLGQHRALLAACRAADRDAGQADIVGHRLDLAPGLHPEALGQRPRTPAALAKDPAQDEARIGGDAGGIELAEPGTGDHHGTDVAHRLASSGMGFDRDCARASPRQSKCPPGTSWMPHAPSAAARHWVSRASA